MKRIIVCAVIFLGSLSSWSQDESVSTKPLSFSKWKQLQEIEAQNKVVRLSNLLLLLKSEKYSPENVLPQIAKESQQEVYIPEQQQQELISQTEAQLKTAVASLDFAKELTLNDYFSVYLRQYKNNPEALTSLVSVMNPSEMVEIIKNMIVINTTPANLNLEDKIPVELTAKQSSPALDK